MLMGIPLTMAYWFAPALIVLRNDEPLAAMKTNSSAPSRNPGGRIICIALASSGR